MPIQTLHLRSNVQGKEPVAGTAAGQLPVGSIGINFNKDEPFLTIQDSAGAIRRIAGIKVGAAAPASPTAGEAWLDISVATKPVFKVHDGTAWQGAGSGVSTGSAAPAAPAAGDLWVDTTTATAPVLKVYNGTAFVAVTPDATDAVKGVVELATATETVDGVDTTRAVTPAGLKSALGAQAGSSTAPASPVVGQVWVDNSTSPSVVKVWGGTPAAWIPQVGGTVTGATAPTTPVAGTIWIDTSATPNVVKVWDGTAWVTAAPDGSAAAAIANDAKYATKAEMPWKRTGTNTVLANAGDRVGLGTSSPQVDLDIAPAASTATLRVQARSTSSPVPAIELMRGTSTTFAGDIYGDYRIKNDNASFIIEYGASSTTTGRFCIDSAGLVGIGTATASRLLHVSSSSGDGAVALEGGSAAAAFVEFKINGAAKSYVGTANVTGAGTSNDMTVWNTANGYINFGTNSTEKARLTADGKFLVGTSSARAVGFTSLQAPVQVETTTAAAYTAVNNTNDANGCYVSIAKTRGTSAGAVTAVQNNDELGAIRISGSDGTGFVVGAQILAAVDGTPGTNDLPTRLVFSTTADGASSPTERMRIGNTGLLRAYSTGDGFYQNVSAGAGTSTALYIGNRSATDILGSGATNVIYIWSNGNVQNTNGSYTTISDLKLKENIVDASSQWDDLKAIQIRNWNFKAETGHETHRQIGPIAQELEQVCPGLVFETPDRDEDGNETGEVTKGVNQSVLYMKAVKALQEAMERIEALEAKVAALEGA
jgi:Chaperone of endosialidase